MGVPRDKAPEVVDRLEVSARSVGFLEEIKGKIYVTLQGTATPHEPVDEDAPDHQGREPLLAAMPQVPVTPEATHRISGRTSALTSAIAEDLRRKKVFITHGKNRDLVEPIRKLLEYGELEPVISVERQSVSKPVPEKVMDDMRSSGAAIIHVDADKTLTDTAGLQHVLLNPNVLIEIGAAMAFYGRRFILLVRDGVKLPSNLQGLYEVRYSGETLDAVSTIKLLEAIKDIKNHPLPTESDAGE